LNSHIKGECLCGTSSYEWRNESKEVVYCHCNDCKKATGSAYSLTIEADIETLSILSGDLNEYKKVSDSGNIISREFCPECGSILFIKIDSYPDLVWINAGNLIESEMIKPTQEIWTKRKVSWAHIDDTLPSKVEE
jgi:hypothetical protein